MPRIVIWNMQGGQGNHEAKWHSVTGMIGNPGQVENLGVDPPEVLLLQECSDVPALDNPQGWAVVNLPAHVTCGSKNFGTQHAPRCYFVAHYDFGVGNNRVSFAVLVGTAAVHGMVNGVARMVAADLRGGVVVHPCIFAPNLRAIIGVTLARHGGNVTYYSMHAPSGVHINTSRTYVTEKAQQAGNGNAGYVIGGDFNCTPADLGPIAGGTIVGCGQATHGGQNPRELDYFMWHNAPNALVTDPARLGILQSDHYPVAANTP